MPHCKSRVIAALRRVRTNICRAAASFKGGMADVLLDTSSLLMYHIIRFNR